VTKEDCKAYVARNCRTHKQLMYDTYQHLSFNTTKFVKDLQEHDGQTDCRLRYDTNDTFVNKPLKAK